MKLTYLYIFAGLFVFQALISSCHKASQWHVAEGAVWNTTYRIVYDAPRPLDDSIQAVLHRIEMSLSPFNEQSLISKINRGQTDSTDYDIQRVFNISQNVNMRTGGRFDPTVAPLVNLWGFGTDRARRIAADTDTAGFDVPQILIDNALLIVGINECLIANNHIVKKSPATTFNFSAVTKGYGCDEVSAMLRRNGSENHLVEIGGEIAIAGKNRKSEPWNIQIDAPIASIAQPKHQALRTIELVGPAGIATSGNYRNYHQTARHGRFGHTIDLSTGHPTSNNVLSATIVAPTAAEADAWATAAMILPPDTTLHLIQQLNNEHRNSSTTNSATPTPTDNSINSGNRGVQAILVILNPDSTQTILESPSL